MTFPIRWVSFVLAVASTVGAETYLDREITIAIDDLGLAERVRISVQIDEPGDIDEWSSYPVVLDDGIELEAFAAEVERPDGGRTRLPKRKLEKETSVGFGLHTSTYALVADLPKLHLGDRIHLDITRTFVLSYPAHRVRLALGADQDRLRIHVRGPTDTLRWRLSGWNDQLVVEHGPTGLELRGDDLGGMRARDHEPDGTIWRPSLWLAWDADGTWNGVAAWYSNLLGGQTAAAPAVPDLVRSLTAGLDDPRDRLAALAGYAKTMIRYEAVEIGEGAYIPSPSGEVLERGWGDCKDKSKLLVDLLAEAGITAHMVLVRSGRDAVLDPGFPTTLIFNHAVVAVPVDDLLVADDDPVVDGFLLIDPTQDRGAPLWLNPQIQGADALVVTPSGAALVSIPVNTGTERSELVVEGTVDHSGSFGGTARLCLIGDRALPWVRGMDSLEPTRLDQFVRESFQLLLPGFDLHGTVLDEIEGGPPTVVLTARVRQSAFAGLAGSLVRFRPPISNPLPDTRSLDDRTRPIVVEPGLVRTLWMIELPPNWCPVDEIDNVVRNDIGSFAHRVIQETETTVRIEAEVVLDRWWCPAGNADDLRELGVAAGRASRRSVRLRCPAEDTTVLE